MVTSDTVVIPNPARHQKGGDSPARWRGYLQSRSRLCQSKRPCLSRSQHPEIRQRTVIPKEELIAVLIQLSDPHAVLVRCSFFRNGVHADLGEIQVCADIQSGGEFSNGVDTGRPFVVLEPEQVAEQSPPLTKEFLQRAEEGLEKNLRPCHKNEKERLENMTTRVYTTLRRRKEDLPWLLSMRN